MTWTKAPQALIELFAESLPDDASIQRRRMFGYPVAFVNGNMFAGLFGDSVFARMPPERWKALEREHGANAFEPMPGRISRRYLGLPDAIVADEGALAEALAAAFIFTAALPPKVKRPSKARTKAAKA
jgi:hypothetical protein